jgi:hypothetical protein
MWLVCGRYFAKTMNYIGEVFVWLVFCYIWTCDKNFKRYPKAGWRLGGKPHQKVTETPLQQKKLGIFHTCNLRPALGQSETLPEK